MTAFFERNRETVRTLYAIINGNQAKTSALTRISVLATINQAYGYVHYLEAKLQVSVPSLFDETIVRATVDHASER